jgi:hypothetical protein
MSYPKKVVQEIKSVEDWEKVAGYKVGVVLETLSQGQ